MTLGLVIGPGNEAGAESGLALKSGQPKSKPVEQNTVSDSGKKLITTGNSIRFNPTFKGLVELIVDLNPNLLYANRHTAVAFKENLDPNTSNISANEGPIKIVNSNLAIKG